MYMKNQTGQLSLGSGFTSTVQGTDVNFKQLKTKALGIQIQYQLHVWQYYNHNPN